MVKAQGYRKNSIYNLPATQGKAKPEVLSLQYLRAYMHWDNRELQISCVRIRHSGKVYPIRRSQIVLNITDKVTCSSVFKKRLYKN